MKNNKYKCKNRIKRRILFTLLVLWYIQIGVLFAPERKHDIIYYMDKYLKIFKNIDYREVLTILWVESRCQTQAIRERKDGGKDWGIGQVSGKTADWIDKVSNVQGINKNYEKLLILPIGLYYAMWYMSYQKKRYGGDTIKMFAAYNKGKVIYKDNSRQFINQWHVDKCLKVYNKLNKKK